MARDVIPSREAELVGWMSSNSTKLNAMPARYGASASQALLYKTAVDSYVALYNQTVDPDTRTRAKIAAKNAARHEAITAARQIIKVVEGFPEITDELRIELGLSPRKQPTPWPVPETAPTVTITNFGGNTLKVMLRDQDVLKRGKPPMTKSAAVYYWVGEETPNENTPWLTFANTGRTMFNMEFPSVLPKGTQVWVIAAWMNNRGQFGPSSAPQSALLLGQSTFQNGNLKLAA